MNLALKCGQGRARLGSVYAVDGTRRNCAAGEGDLQFQRVARWMGKTSRRGCRQGLWSRSIGGDRRGQRFCCRWRVAFDNGVGLQWSRGRLRREVGGRVFGGCGFQSAAGSPPNPAADAEYEQCEPAEKFSAPPATGSGQTIMGAT
jgi:hypothetical protein